VDIDDTLREIRAEAERAAGKYGPPTSTHESLGVLLEEFDELKNAVHANKSESVRAEAIQVAAVAYRLALAVAGGNIAFYDRSGFNRGRH
jgi:NTP pyrophosphatase (non-canonical NTP hydrolase)